MRRFVSIMLMLVLVLSIAACGGTGSRGNTGSRFHNTYGADWSPRELRAVAKKMILSMSRARWFKRANFARIRWVLAKEMKNDTDEHINTRVIMEKIRTGLINQYEVRFIDDEALKDILRRQKLQQSDLFDSSTVVKVGRLVGARLMIRGRVSNMRRRTGRETANFIIVRVSIVDMQTGDIRWENDYEKRKLNIRSRYR